MSERLTDDWALYEIASDIDFWERVRNVCFSIAEKECLSQYLQIYKKYLSLSNQIFELKKQLPPPPQINEATRTYKELNQEAEHIKEEIYRLVENPHLQNILSYRFNNSTPTEEKDGDKTRYVEPERNYLQEYEEYRAKKRIAQKQKELKFKQKKSYDWKTIKTITYTVTLIVGIISTILSFVFFELENSTLIYGVIMVFLYFGGHFIFKIDRFKLTKICSPLIVPIFLALIIGYISPNLESMMIVIKAFPVFITISVLLFERELLY